MELNTEDASVTMLEAHDESIVGPGCFEEHIRQVGVDHKRVVSNHLDSLRNAFKEPLAVVRDRSYLPMHRPRSWVNSSAEDHTNSLMSQTDAKDRLLAVPQDVGAHAKV